jgi:hypothetical protein
VRKRYRYPWDEMHEEYREIYREQARAALACIKDDCQ